MDLEVCIDRIPVINFSMQQNHVPVVREILLKNKGQEDIADLDVSLSFDPEFADPTVLHVDAVPAQGEVRLNAIPIRLSTTYLAHLTERISGQVRVRVTAAGEPVLFSENYDIDLLAFDQWGGIAILPEMLAAFITPNHPAVMPIIKRASEILNGWTGSPAWDEYQRRDPNRVKKQMAAIYEAITEQQIVYCTVPASFEDHGQRIRLYDDMLSGKLGTCLDMALLYAGCLEAVGIHPLLVLTKGHAFTGGWLIPETFPDSVNDDISLLTKRTADGIDEILLVETTCMNAGADIPFDAASVWAGDKLKNPDDFLLFVDVMRARSARIRPLPQRVIRDGVFEIREEVRTERSLEAPVNLSATDIIIEGGKIPVSKQTIWERKLLDLTLRNSLLNTRITKSTLQLISVKINELEDALAGGQEFQILAKPTDWDNPLLNAGIYQVLHAKDPIVDLVKDELKQKRLRAYLNDEALQRSLTYLYRSSRLSLEENGANTLYLALGLLKWLETPSSTRPRFAPILLLPVEIVRKSAAKGYVIRSRDEETVLNITLLEMLRQYFGIHIGGLDPLPRDESGVDVPKIFNTIRRAVMDRKGWDVEEQAVIGNFSFSKFIMWNDIHNNADKLKRNKIVAGLISGKAEWEPISCEEEPIDLDEKYPAGDVALPIGADSSQFDAVCAAVNEKSFILHGPPGTGKSQTITNIIANALYKGKKVLFVAEKMAALQVVQRRLEAIGLAPFCLELHSNKTKKASVLEQLKRTTEVVKLRSNEVFRIEAERLDALRRELNDSVRALHRRQSTGLSLYECFAEYAKARYEGRTASIPRETLVAAVPAVRADNDVAIAEYETMCRVCGSPGNHPLAGIFLTTYSSAIRTESEQRLSELSGSLRNCKKTTAALSDLLKFDVSELPTDRRQALKEIVGILLTAETLPIELLGSSHRAEWFARIEEAVRIGLEMDKIGSAITDDFDRKILEWDVEVWETQWRASQSKWWLLRLLGQSRVHSRVRSFSKGKRHFTDEEICEVFSHLNAYHVKQKRLDDYSGTLRPILGPLWDLADWKRIEDACRNVKTLDRQILLLTRELSAAESVRESLCNHLGYGLTAFRDLAADKLRAFLDSEAAVSRDTEAVQNLLMTSALSDNDELSFESSLAIVARWMEHLDMLRDWVAYILQRQKVIDRGLGEIVREVEAGHVSTEDIMSYYRKSFFRSYAEYILAQEPVLSAFHGTLFSEKVERFKQLSRDFERLTREELFAKLASALPALQKEAAQSSEVGILQRNIRNGGRGTSIRKLFDQIPDLLTRMCPCMLMSPISVAQYIEVGDNPPFDLVIFDEASQMPTSEAVGAIARGRNVIVVGDPKQMPPTSFFSTSTYDEENADKEDMESILDDCLALSIPSKYLLWHYRSKHESLIAFSNVKYYDNKLLTFPSPDDLATKVGWQHVVGVYDRGKTRQNRAEAEAVIREIERRLLNPETVRRSIGVVTFNTNQQSLIEDLLNELFRRNPELETAALECEEPIFVKNLENVQGDERDVILFSVGYGPDKDGKIALNFGPLNRQGGWRRLNVAVSRARYEMKIFSTLKAEQIDLNRTSAEGVAGLKAFLEYAEKGRSVLYYNRPAESSSDDALLESISEELAKRGYAARTNVGCSGYKIDIGIVDPQHPDKYLLGVLCDGHNYKAARTAQDRLVTQSGVLRMLGWRLHRVWAMDWWENRSRTIDSIIEAVEAAENQVDPPGEEPVRAEPSSKSMVPEADLQNFSRMPVEEESSCRSYNRSILEYKSVSADDLVSGIYDEEILDRISAVVNAEAPINKGLLCRRVLNSFGIARMGTRLSAYMDVLLECLSLPVTGKDFYWRKDQNPKEYSIYRPDSRREALDIAPEEVCVALCRILQEQGSLPQDSLARETAHLFNYTRMGENVLASMSRGIAYALEKGRITRSEQRIKLA